MENFSIEMVVRILTLTEPKIFRQMGLNMSPIAGIITKLIVPPCSIRPCVQFSDSSRTRKQDDLTLKLQEILKQCQRIGKQPTPSLIQKLQIEVSTYFNNEGTSQLYAPTKHSGLQEKCILKRFKGKYGRIRGNCMGKRVDFSARTVISPGCHVDIDEVGVPQFIARKLTIDVHVTQYNLAYLTRLVQENKIISFIKPDGKKQLMKYCNTWPNIRLKLGWIVQRQLLDGDYVLLNRQPSLRKKSIMGHRVKIWSGKTIQLNLSCTQAYNADFDGDEMNIHCPQDIESQTEIRQLMAVDKQIMNAQNNKPIVTVIQDTLVGCYLLTADDTFITRDVFMNCVMHVKYPVGDITILPTPAIVSPTVLWTGKQLFSTLLPSVTVHKHDMSIVKGQLLKGRITKRTFQFIINVLCQLTTLRTCMNFMTNTQLVVI